MGLRFQRRVIFPGLYLNLSCSGIGFSVGTRGAHIGITGRGQRYWSVGAPGTGLSWRQYEHQAKRPKAQGNMKLHADRGAVSPPQPARCELCAQNPGHLHIDGAAVVLLVGLGGLAFVLGYLLGR